MSPRVQEAPGEASPADGISGDLGIASADLRAGSRDAHEADAFDFRGDKVTLPLGVMVESVNFHDRIRRQNILEIVPISSITTAFN